MKFLRKYNLTESDILELNNKLSERDKLEIMMHEERVDTIVKYLFSVGIFNLKDIFLYKTNIFYDDVENIKDVLKPCNQSDIALINSDVFQLDLFGI